jgi:hypothetical protein
LVFRYLYSFPKHSDLKFHGRLRREGIIVKHPSSDKWGIQVFVLGSWVFFPRTLHAIYLFEIYVANWLKRGILEGQKTII